jgi:hypothetical protein
MARLRFYGSLVTISIEFTLPSAGAKSCHERTFRFGFLSLFKGPWRTSGSCIHPFFYLLRSIFFDLRN